MRPDDELLDLIDRRRRAVRDLPGWRSGPERLLTLLQRATRLRAMEIAQGLDTNVPWESVLAQIITWRHEIPVGDGPCGDEEAMDICLATLEAARLDNLHGTVRAGGYEVRRRGDSFRIRHRWNPAVEAADIFLEHATAPADLPEITSVERVWIKSRPRHPENSRRRRSSTPQRSAHERRSMPTATRFRRETSPIPSSSMAA